MAHADDASQPVHHQGCQRLACEVASLDQNLIKSKTGFDKDPVFLCLMGTLTAHTLLMPLNLFTTRVATKGKHRVSE